MKTDSKINKLGAAMIAASLVACAAGEGETFTTDETKGIPGFKGDAIDVENDPVRFDRSLERRFDKLPLEGEATRPPWSGDYWASRNDSINVRWDGSELSPAEKYAKAFGRPGVPEEVSKLVGKKSSAEEIPGWVGICEGWAAAAIREPAPIKPVVRNGVTFYPGDLEGLMSIVYARGNASSKFLSRRCYDAKAELDENGRPKSSACRDANPGALHIIVTNYLGTRGEALVEDRTYDAEVWNQPLRGYRIESQKEISRDAANELVGGAKGVDTALLEGATLAKDEQRTGVTIMPAAGVLHINLSGTGDADLHVNPGAPGSGSAWECRPYAGDSNESCTIRAAAGTEVHWMVAGYAASSTVKLVQTTPVADAPYAFNPAAKRFAEVKLALDYITESSPARTSFYDQLDEYTRTDNYHYVLELAADGTIIGGEYVGSSRTNHPDFLWLPSGNPIAPKAGIRYSEVKALFNEAAQ